MIPNGSGKIDRVVYITENCLAALMASCLETPYKETGGFLIGKGDKRFIMGERRECLTLDLAYPVRTSKSGKSFWQPSNLRAYNRIIDTIKLMSFNIVGEYHSHVKNLAELSDDDKKFIAEEIRDFEKGGIKIYDWIEMVLNTEKKSYKRKPKRSCECSYFSKKMRCTVRGIRDPLSGYSVTIGTYWFNPETLEYKEANVHIP